MAFLIRPGVVDHFLMISPNALYSYGTPRASMGGEVLKVPAQLQLMADLPDFPVAIRAPTVELFCFVPTRERLKRHLFIAKSLDSLGPAAKTRP